MSVQKNVLEFEITMGYTLLMHALECIDHLQTEKAADIFTHWAEELAEVEQ